MVGISDMINLYDEIGFALNNVGKIITDILWVGTKEETMDLKGFLQVSKEIDYDNGFGGAKIATDLIIVGVDWWLSREEYDGSEWWGYHAYPQKPQKERTKEDYSLYGYKLFEGDYL
jgi:hypothetical protein